MSDGDNAKPEEENGGEEAEAAAEAQLGKFTGKLKFVLIGVAVLLLAGGGAGLYFSGILFHEKPHEVTVDLPGPPVYQDIQRITVDLKPSPGHARPLIRLSLQAELEGESAQQAFLASETRIMDAMQSHLRDLTVEELAGEQGTARLREDLTIIINRIIAPERAVSVLYKEILIR